MVGVEETDDGLRLTLAAERRAEPDEAGRAAVLRRRVVYDTGRKLAVSADVVFESNAGPESEKI